MAKQVLRYLKGTYDRCLKFVKGPQLKLVGYSDSDWAMSDDRRRLSINQSFILTRYVKELKNSFKIRTCINKIYNNYGFVIILFNFKNNSINICNRAIYF